jgi:hypothetical protein
VLARLPRTQGEYQFALLDMEDRRLVRRGPSAEHHVFAVVQQHGDVFYVQAHNLDGAAVLGRVAARQGNAPPPYRCRSLRS